MENEKKNSRCMYIFLNFPVVGNEKIKEKKKKITIMIIINLVQKMIWATANCIARKALYCDIVALDVQKRWIVLQEKRCAVVQVYCNRGSWLLKKLYCNTVYCI